MNDLAYDKLKCFFYLLLRDEIPFGKVNEIIEKMPQKDGHYPCHFTSEELESYCEKIVEKICGIDATKDNTKTLRSHIKNYSQDKKLLNQHVTGARPELSYESVANVDPDPVPVSSCDSSPVPSETSRFSAKQLCQKLYEDMSAIT